MISIRQAQWPRDADLLTELDTSFSTDRIYRPVREEFAFRLESVPVKPALTKTYPFDPSDPKSREEWDYALVAEEDGRLAGFAAAQYVSWNRRLTLQDLYVMPALRGQGIGRQLLSEVDVYAQAVQARCLWLETQNVNYPAIQFYLRLGFVFCGFDAGLYDPDTLMQDEIALFFTRPVAPLPTADLSGSLQSAPQGPVNSPNPKESGPPCWTAPPG